MLCNAYDDMPSFSSRSKHQRCYTPDRKGPRDGDHLECLGQEVSLLSVVLTPFIGAHDLLGVGYCSGPVEALSECVPNQGSWHDMVTADPTVDVA